MMSRHCAWIKVPEPTVDVIYVYVGQRAEYSDNASRFIESYLKHPPGYPHGTIVMCNQGMPRGALFKAISLLPGMRLVPGSNVGHDIGAYLAASKVSTADMCLFCGANAHFHRSGWLKRMVDAWVKYGPGVYCSSTSYEVTCHFNTTGFWCDRQLMASYPFAIRNKEDRYNFEHGRSNLSQNINKPDIAGHKTFWKMCYRSGYPVILVTWDGEYDWWNWRKPPNIFRRGDQSNMLVHWKHTDNWAAQSPEVRDCWSKSTDNLTDADFNVAARTFL